MTAQSAGAGRRWTWALAGGLIALLAGYLFFHDDGDAFVEGWLATIILGVAGACVGYLLSKQTRGSASG